MKALWWGAGLDQMGRRWKDPLKLPGSQLELTVPWFSASSLPSVGFCCLSFHLGSQRPRSVLVSYGAEAASVSSGPAGSAARRLRTAEARRGGSCWAFSFPSHRAPCFAFLWICPEQMLEWFCQPITYLLFILIISRLAMITFKKIS